AVFTQEQIDCVVEDIQERARYRTRQSKQFFTDKEWELIDQAVAEVGEYAQVYVSRAVAGDTGMHLALRLGSLKAAQVYSVTLHLQDYFPSLSK
ncbi:unnamed protein product, partial [Choristocarpus tenellus]